MSSVLEQALEEAFKNLGEPVAYIHKWKPHAAIIGKSLHFTDTSPHGDDVEIIPLYTSAPEISQANLPAGWQLVPIEPTDAMFAAGDQFMECTSSLGEAWEAMLSAAPKGEAA